MFQLQNIITKKKVTMLNLAVVSLSLHKGAKRRLLHSFVQGRPGNEATLGSSIKYKHQNKKTKVNLGLGETYVARAKCTLCTGSN